MQTLGKLALVYVAERRRRGEIMRTTAKTVGETLWQFAETVGADKPPNRITRRQVELWRDGMTVAPGTIRNRLSICRTFFDWCVAHDHCRSNPVAGLRPPKAPRYLPRALKAEQVQAALAECPDERAVLMVLLECQEGLRAKEVAGLQLGDVDFGERLIVVRGKGDHERVLPVSDETWEALHRYLTTCPAKAGPLIRSQSHPHRPLVAGYVARLVSQWLHDAGVDATGHCLRHTSATDMLRRGADLLEVRDALGHRSIATTERYLPLARVNDLRKAMGGRRYQHPRSAEGSISRLQA